MKTNKEIKKNVTIAVLIALSVIFSYFDSLISQAMFGAIQFVIPRFKLGLANIIVLIFICCYKIREGIVAIILKSILVALLFSGVTGFLIGFPGTVLSFIVMTLLYKVFKNEKYLVFVSAIGGASHSIGQIIAAFMIYGINEIEAYLIYAPIILIISIVTGILVGIVAQKVIRILKSHFLFEDKTPDG